MKYIILFSLSLISLVSVSQTDCGSLAKKNENYGAGDNNKSWCEMPDPTPYIKCMCERERNNATNQKLYNQEKDVFEKEFLKLKALGGDAEKNNDNVKAIEYLEQAISFAKSNPHFQKQHSSTQNYYTDNLYTRIRVLKRGLDNNSSEEGEEIRINNTNSNKNTRQKEPSNNSESEKIQNEIQSNINRIEANSKALEDQLISTFSTIQQNMIKEKDFQNKVNSLTSIQATDANGIIAEARQKAQQISQTFNHKSKEKYNEVNQVGGTLIQDSKSETELGLNVAATAIAHGVSQNNIKKEKEAALKKLESEKERELQVVANEFSKSYKKSLNKHLELTSFALNENDASFYMNFANYDECMVKNARQIIINGTTCELNQTSKIPIEKNNYSGQEYYEAYQFKLNSENKYIRKNAELFLELAIQKEPKNIEWLYESAQFNDITEKVAILKKCSEFSGSYKKEYFSLLKTYVEIKEKLAKITSAENNLNLLKNKVLTKYGKNIILKDIHFYGGNYNKQVKVSYENKMFLVYNKSKRLYGYINENADIIIPMIYKCLGKFSNGLAVAKLNNKYGYIDTSGNTIIKHNYKKTLGNQGAYDFSNNGLAKVYIKGNLYYINKNGEIIISPPYKKYILFGDNFENGVTRIITKGETKYLNSNGNEISFEEFSTRKNTKINFNIAEYLTSKSIQFDNVHSLDEDYNLCAIWLNKEFRIYNLKLNKFINNHRYIFVDVVIQEYPNIKSKTRGLGVINRNGVEIIAPKLGQEIKEFSKGHAIIKRNNKYGLINLLGKLVIPCEYDMLSYPYEGRLIFGLGDQTGAIDINNKIIIPLGEGHLSRFNNGISYRRAYYVKKNGEEYQIITKYDINGKIIK